MGRRAMDVLLAAVTLAAAMSVAALKEEDNNALLQVANLHMGASGPHLPSAAFMAALDAAAMDVSHLAPGDTSAPAESNTPRRSLGEAVRRPRRALHAAGRTVSRSLVLLGMANAEALQKTVPLFLESMRRLVHADSAGRKRTLDSHVVLSVWSEADMRLCRALRDKPTSGQPPRHTFLHQCVHDAAHQVQATGGPPMAFHFHSAAFNALGFAKIKYILNGLSAGHDVMFMDTDIVMLRNPAPHLVGLGADMATVLEKCVVVDEAWDYARPSVRKKGLPHFNIGFLYYRATAGTTRCVLNWFYYMWQEAHVSSTVWDQGVYRWVMEQCTLSQGVSWRALDPRVFQSACYQQCGCAFDDSELAARRLQPGRYAPFINRNVTCGPQYWEQWTLMHFACSGSMDFKAARMAALLQGMDSGEPGYVNPPIGWRPGKKLKTLL